MCHPQSLGGVDILWGWIWATSRELCWRKWLWTVVTMSLLVTSYVVLKQAVCTLNIRRLPNKFWNTIFIAANLFCNSLNVLIGKIEGCATRLILLHTLDQLRQPCAHEKQEHLPRSCISLNFVVLATSSLLQDIVIITTTCSYKWHLWGLQRGGNLREQDLGSMVTEKNGPSLPQEIQ